MARLELALGCAMALHGNMVGWVLGSRAEHSGRRLVSRVRDRARSGGLYCAEFLRGGRALQPCEPES